MTKKNAKAIQIEAKEVPIKWNIPDDIITRFTNNIIIQKVENVFKISFFEVKPDIHLGSSKDTTTTEVQAYCVASVVMTPNKLADLKRILERQLELFQTKDENK
jgi:hypothetical protein